MEELEEIVKEEVRYYAGSGLGYNVRMYYIADEKRCIYAVLGIDFPVPKQDPLFAVLARIANDTVVIEVDNTDRPLLDSLLARGVPRERIILAYRGEPIPEQAELLGEYDRKYGRLKSITSENTAFNP